MTNVYFIRHAESDTSVLEGRIRPLTERGLASRVLVTGFLQDKDIELVFSSPFKRAVDTISPFAKKSGLDIEIIEDLREQKSSSDMRRENPEASSYLRRQWANFDYSYSDGETIGEVQSRNIAALKGILTKHKNKNIAIGTHGTALTTIINYYDNSYGFEAFEEMEFKLPWAAGLKFDGLNCIEIEKIDLY